jgi:hypothetical protein
MLTAGVSISQVTSTPVNPTASTKQSTSKLLSFRKHAVSSLQGNEIEDQASVPKDVTNITLPFKDSHSASSKMPGRSDCSRDTVSKVATTLGSRSQSSGCKLSTASATGPSIKSGHTQIIAIPRSVSSAVGQDNPIYKETQAIPKISNPFVPRSEISESTVTKNKSLEKKDMNPSNIYKNQSGTKGSRSPASLQNIGHEITVTPSSTTASSITMLNRLHQQSTEVIAKPKAATLDLHVSIPSSITITAKQQSTPDGNFSSGQQGRQGSGGGDCFRSGTQKVKDSVSITEIGRKVSAGSQGAKRVGGSSAVKQKEQKVDEKHGSAVGDAVEIITLE